MVDARSDVRLTQRLVDERCPPLPQDEVLLAVIGQLAPATLEGLKIETCFRTETRRRHLAGRGQQVGVEIARVAAGTGLVYREIHGYLVALRQVSGKGPCQRYALAGIQLRGQADLILACDARIVALFGMLRGVPQFLAIAGPRDRQAVELSRQEYLGMQHVPAAPVIDQLAAALVARRPALRATELICMKNMATSHAPRRTLTRSQTGEDAALRYPVRSGSCSSSEGSTAISVTRCSLTLVERRAPRAVNQLSRSRPREVCRRITSRSPMRREANCDVPPCSLPEQRRISVLPQFSTTRLAIAMAPST